MEQYPGAGLTASQLLYALGREIDDFASKRRSDGEHITISLRLTSDPQATSVEHEAGRGELLLTRRHDRMLKSFRRCRKWNGTS